MNFRIVVVWVCFIATNSGHAQAAPTATQTVLPIGIRFVATEANAPPGSCGCFWLTGAGADVAIPLRHRFSVAVDLAGDTTKQVPATTRGLSLITLLAGPRYTLPIGRRLSMQAQALFGVARGFDADFIVSPQQHTDTASVFGMALGAAVEVPINRRITLRALQVEYLQTNLPNGADNRQKNLRLGAGLVFQVRLPKSR
jgi:outer membrane immunogenic protein